jgi:hypothetical protein
MTQAVHLAAVFLDGKELRMSEGERTQEHVLGKEPSELTLTWQERCPTVGQAVKITTGARRHYYYCYCWARQIQARLNQPWARHGTQVYTAAPLAGP